VPERVATPASRVESPQNRYRIYKPNYNFFLVHIY
jgi:hypothetical protein